jgi:HK97 family phage major capsid protein
MNTQTAPSELTEDQSKDFQTMLTDIRAGWADVKSLPASLKSIQQENSNLSDSLEDLRGEVRRNLLLRSPRSPGRVSDDCARRIAATFIQHCARSGALEALASQSTQRDALVNFACHSLDITTRTALTTSDIPLPSEYSGEIRELISEFGVVRRRMSPYPIGMGTSRPARMGTRPSFGSIAISGAFGEKSPTVTFASLESHKIGGIVRVPREIDEQSVVAMGQFLARYGAIEFARVEDNWGFLADGGGTYETVKGIVQIARDNSKTVTLASTKTHPSDATLADFRSLRTKVNKAALNGRLSAYYLDSTWETQLPTFKTAAETNVYQRLPDGTAILDGYPIVWTDVLQAFTTSAAAD